MPREIHCWRTPKLATLDVVLWERGVLQELGKVAGVPGLP